MAAPIRGVRIEDARAFQGKLEEALSKINCSDVAYVVTNTSRHFRHMGSYDLARFVLDLIRDRRNGRSRYPGLPKTGIFREDLYEVAVSSSVITVSFNWLNRGGRITERVLTIHARDNDGHGRRADPPTHAGSTRLPPLSSLR